jgi:hypothetical protein
LQQAYNKGELKFTGKQYSNGGKGKFSEYSGYSVHPIRSKVYNLILD